MVISQVGISFFLSSHPYPSPQNNKKGKICLNKVNNKTNIISLNSRECCYRGFVI